MFYKRLSYPLELTELEKRDTLEIKRDAARNQAEKYERMSENSLDAKNRQKYAARAKQWREREAEVNSQLKDFEEKSKPKTSEKKSEKPQQPKPSAPKPAEKPEKPVAKSEESGIIKLNRKANRKTANIGAFSNLKMPMQKRTVLSICKKYGIDTKGIIFKIQRSEKMLGTDFYGSTDYDNIGRIDLFPNAFIDEEQLVRTILHEKCHFKQLMKYGKKFTQENLAEVEKRAYRFEELFYYLLKKKV